MLKKEKVMLVFVLLLLAAFLFGVVRLFQLRFEGGDVYPAYSSLRADPLGTKALYESLEALPGLSVQRHIRELHKLPEGRDTTLFVFGTDASDMDYLSDDEFKTLERFMLEGGRIVVSFYPVNVKPWAVRRDEAKEKKKKSPDKSDAKPGGKRDEPKPVKKRRPLDDEDESPGMKLISLKERWGVSFGYAELPKDSEGKYGPATAQRKDESGLPETVSWHTALYFEKPGTNWQVIYARGKQPVLIGRKFHSGSVVLCADSYFLSNEAMRNERHAELLAWLVGANRNVLFDETHLGVVEEPGVAALVRKYRLHGLVAGLVLLAGLFIWKNAVSFVPPPADDATGERGDLVAGKESAAGFVNLLRRSIPYSELLSVCFVEWKKSCAHGRGNLTNRAERMAAVVAEERSKSTRAQNPVEAYRRINQILTERK